MKFIRYGNKKPQHHILEPRSFHTPPVEYGIYAFPENIVETFLLGGRGSGTIQNGRWQYLRYPNGKKITATYNELFNVTTVYMHSPSGFSYPDYQVSYKPEFAAICKDINPEKLHPYVLDPDCGTIDDLYIDGSNDPDANTPFNWIYERKPWKFDYNGNIWCHFKEHLKPHQFIQVSGSWCLIPIKLYKDTLPKVLHWMKYNYAMASSQSFKHRPGGIPLRCFDKDIFEIFIEKV